jgi:hypothetical protein
MHHDVEAFLLGGGSATTGGKLRAEGASRSTVSGLSRTDRQQSMAAPAAWQISPMRSGPTRPSRRTSIALGKG